MTPEEIAALQELLAQADPWAVATNQYGQGAGFLGLDDQPESWDRMGEKNDLYYDLFRTTGTYLEDFVPGLYPEVEAPSEPYVSDTAGLYSGSPVYQEIYNLVTGADGGAPVGIDQALNALRVKVQEDPEAYAQYLPQRDAGAQLAGNTFDVNGVDWYGIRSGAESYIAERAKEDRSRAEVEAYEDFVRPRTAYELAGSPEYEDVRESLFNLKPERPVSSRDIEREMSRIPSEEQTQIRSGDGPARRARGDVVPEWFPGQEEDRRARLLGAEARTPGRIPTTEDGRRIGRGVSGEGSYYPEDTGDTISETRGDRTEFSRDPRFDRAFREVQRRNENPAERLYRASFERSKANAQQRQVASKRDENRARLVAAYNMLMYGE